MLEYSIGGTHRSPVSGGGGCGGVRAGFLFAVAVLELKWLPSLRIFLLVLVHRFFSPGEVGNPENLALSHFFRSSDMSWCTK